MRFPFLPEKFIKATNCSLTCRYYARVYSSHLLWTVKRPRFVEIIPSNLTQMDDNNEILQSKLINYAIKGGYKQPFSKNVKLLEGNTYSYITIT